MTGLEADWPAADTAPSPGSTGWLENLPQYERAVTLAAMRRLRRRYDPKTAGELLRLLRRWAYALRYVEPSFDMSIRAALRADRPGALVLAEALLAERREPWS